MQIVFGDLEKKTVNGIQRRSVILLATMKNADKTIHNV